MFAIAPKQPQPQAQSTGIDLGLFDDDNTFNQSTNAPTNNAKAGILGAYNSSPQTTGNGMNGMNAMNGMNGMNPQQQQGVHGQFNPNFNQMNNGMNGFNPNGANGANGFNSNQPRSPQQQQVPPQNTAAAAAANGGGGWVGFGNNASPQQPQANGKGDLITGQQAAHRDSKNAILGKYKSNPTNEFMTSLGPRLVFIEFVVFHLCTDTVLTLC